VLERQRVYTWARKGQINDEDMVQQLAAIGIEESGIQRELSEKRLLVGNRAERLIELAQDYRERVKNGIEGLNGKPQNEEETRLQFTFRRKLVEGIVKRVDVLSDKTITVQVELDLNDPATDLFTRGTLPP